MFESLLVLFVAGAMIIGLWSLLKNWREERHAKRLKYPGAPGEPYCCEQSCSKDAEFGIYGSSGHFEDVTETCVRHVGALLGTPTWLPKMNDHSL
ncbi:hypothetical protein LCGC14_2415890 [marine sediment metagenome]|uniref:Uncharacterized protein n=1 Tax=marine sediment metagenome TaxID=412755 RepID=A0A0F9BR55_9ZZZZ